MGALCCRDHSGGALSQCLPTRNRPLEDFSGNVVLSVQPPDRRKSCRACHSQALGYQISSITRVMSRSAKTHHASEKTLESLQDCAALLTIFCGSINPTQSPKIVTPPHSAASSSSVLCAFSKYR